MLHPNLSPSLAPRAHPAFNVDKKKNQPPPSPDQILVGKTLVQFFLQGSESNLGGGEGTHFINDPGGHTQHGHCKPVWSLERNARVLFQTRKAV